MKLIVGLGNPGERYRFTRHNMGFLALEEIAWKWNVALTQKGFKSVYGKGVFNDIPVILLQPQTYMNLSGTAVQEIAHYFKINTTDIIVIHDDLDFPFGMVRLKLNGGYGGHKGLSSIAEHINTSEFVRIRIGIDRPVIKDDVENFVLQIISKKQLQELPDILLQVTEMVEMLIEKGTTEAMNKFHSS
ncbi:MAG: aminoacyl-tRNA hydrolase [Deltaproteobacteria bacterium]